MIKILLDTANDSLFESSLFSLLFELSPIVPNNLHAKHNFSLFVQGLNFEGIKSKGLHLYLNLGISEKANLIAFLFSSSKIIESPFFKVFGEEVF